MQEKTANSAIAYGLATIAADGTILDTWYPRPSLADNTPAGGTRHLTPEEARAALGEHVPTSLGRDTRRKVDIVAVRTAIASLDAPPADAHDAYLRLHLLSHRLIRPHGANLDGLFNVLANVAWTSAGPCAVDQVDALRWQLRATGQVLEIRGVDKIPRMTDYVVPAGVRIADTARVRLGAHLAAGTTVLHEGFCNFNAGTLGASMVEGRISAGVIVDDGTDIGGGASIMGTMSGGGKQVVAIGKRCLLGANSGIGISLGDDCVVEAGCYITAGTRVLTPEGAVVKAVELAGQHGLLFRRNSQTGAVETLVRTAAWGTLNPALHTGH
ncbi:MAG: 2,3,4,5-tetrahydropyridine-2,6-dicarboxylate N-succinyltransferase [Achromobacter sp.]|uniref:2,3,4,5-tetrahydropyridine-2,6-dicarboxylate N-succinyltransferase n=1 Tax=Achromobacter pulmonis TaxID=1389932 RepID=A0A6S7CLA4_9BURK|nr:2,3,4,5-tetrahydropyridine-2,6-dicarboxylate N-succinyltransferase [Achromobacter pulmonis]MCF7767344.1 2,3,4,5-tetrahydropyridine-2,6-dicarboxylate N-succinyltransferase [Achromobacter pulmonis]MPT27556.1 2,3,4,5-tetrahydropyridine-2,6-dicarboxylate N-succinyltransferase [Achromobacter sp.]CAB3632120.1 2,3,4,5-tetrahydropyridine-2,6-dicarboxylate N-succinyltransferase [Achromobacter pulmonis]CAB3836570.1 2,3,4,5-tetrahydropyridine-2,6-dicarboxylate N-succinyltransferase [Achromobacter pulmo